MVMYFYTLIFHQKTLEQVSPKLLEVARRAALMHSDKNRSNDFLPRKSLHTHVATQFKNLPSEVIILEFFFLIADKWRVRLKGRSPGQDYIHASYVHVC